MLLSETQRKRKSDDDNEKMIMIMMMTMTTKKRMMEITKMKEVVDDQADMADEYDLPGLLIKAVTHSSDLAASMRVGLL